MCDYSLEMYHSRPARAGERYVLHRFRSGSLGVRAANNREFLLQSLNPGVSAVLLPCNLEAVFDLKVSTPTTVDRTENAAAPVAAHAVARLARYLACCDRVT